MSPLNAHRHLVRASLALLIAFTIATPAFADPVSSAFTYQGQLKQGGNNANGTYDLQFSLWDALAGPTQVGSAICLENVAVADGLFTVNLDFGPAAFGTQARWLQIAVRPDNTPGNCGGGAYTTLAPRQRILPAPVAQFALGADGPNLTNLNASNLATGTVPSAALSGNYGGALNFTNPANTYTGNGAALNGLNATNVASGTLNDARLSSNVALLNNSQTFTGAKTFSNAGNSFTGNGAGLTSLNASNIATGNLAIARFPTGGNWALTTNLTIDTTTLAVDQLNNRVGIGIATPSDALHVVGDARISQQIEFDIQAAPMIYAQHNNTIDKRMWISHSESFPDWGIQYRDIASDGLSADRIEFVAGNQTQPRLSFDLAGSGLELFAGARKTIDIDGNIGGESRIEFFSDVNAVTAALFMDVDGNNNGRILIREDGGTNRAVLEVEGTGTSEGAQLLLYNHLGVNTIQLDANWSGTGDGRIVTQELQITGGSDLSEQFDINVDASLELKPGMIVCIDPKNIGELVVSSIPYDRTVAGVVSGAGGVKTGMLMGQRGTEADGRYPVALTGRVYCWCDASNGTISAGDLLTTSSTPGHAMKVNDHARANGAIIGKAMSSLEEGKGLVLVLVSLQ